MVAFFALTALLTGCSPKEKAFLAAWVKAQPTVSDPLACGGDLPPCYVMQRESGGNPYAVNPGHRGAPYADPGDPWTHASGKWQDMPSTWNRYHGYPYAAAAPVSVQDDFNRLLWNHGAGCAHWQACS